MGAEKLVFGLGNPGLRYRETRHNLGFQVVEQVASRLGAAWGEGPGPSRVARVRRGGREQLLACPLTYMNLSGTVLRVLDPGADRDPQSVLVVYDDLDLPCGALRIRRGGSDGGHRGVRSMAEALGTGSFPRVRLGVGPLPPGADAADYVLETPGPDERALHEKTVAEAASAVLVWLDSAPIEIVMSRFNRRAPPGEAPPGSPPGAAPAP
jgi:PTH1 family peptidyl-tRNA hydrolase